MPPATIYHLTPAGYYYAQPPDRPYLPATYGDEGFIHCTAGLPLLVEVANRYFATLPQSENLLVLEIAPQHLTAPLKFEPPLPPPGADSASSTSDDTLFPHIYGPLNRDAVVDCFCLQRDSAGQWQAPAHK